MTSTGADGVVVARIGKPHGLRGEVTVQVHTDDPEQRLAVGERLDTDPADRGPLTITSGRVHKGILMLGFEGVDDRDAAEALRGTRLLAEPEDDDESGWYEDELVGLDAVDGAGERLGTVRALLARPAQDLLEIEVPDGRVVLVPFVEEIVPQVDVDAGQVVLDPPAGLFELGE